MSKIFRFCLEIDYLFSFQDSSLCSKEFIIVFFCFFYVIYGSNTLASLLDADQIVVKINLSSGKYKWKFQNGWLTGERFCGWIQKAENDPHATLRKLFCG